MRLVAIISLGYKIQSPWSLAKERETTYVKSQLWQFSSKKTNERDYLFFCLSIKNLELPLLTYAINTVRPKLFKDNIKGRDAGTTGCSCLKGPGLIPASVKFLFTICQINIWDNLIVSYEQRPTTTMLCTTLKSLQSVQSEGVFTNKLCKLNKDFVTFDY